jgi:glucose/mannose-6-phosphate isomerase
VISVPSGYQPRCAIGYSFFPMLYTLIRLNMFSFKAESEIEEAINETIEIITKKSAIYSKPDDDNIAYSTAKHLVNKIPVIYSSADLLDAVNLRWRDQINENAKHLCYGSNLPEMNHNEINSFGNPEDLVRRISIIYLRDKNDHPRIQQRFDALFDIFGEKVSDQFTFKGNGNYFLTRMFELIYLGDWLSYYIAVLGGVDPTPIPIINYLKKRLTDN